MRWNDYALLYVAPWFAVIGAFWCAVIGIFRSSLLFRLADVVPA